MKNEEYDRDFENELSDTIGFFFNENWHCYTHAEDGASEILNGSFDKVSECMEDAIKWIDAESIDYDEGSIDDHCLEIWGCKKIDYRRLIPCGETIVENMREHEDVWGIEDYMGDVSNGDCKALEKHIQLAVKNWIEEREINTDAFIAEDHLLISYKDMKRMIPHIKKKEQEREEMKKRLSNNKEVSNEKE